MAGDEAHATNPEWLIDPPGYGDVRIHLAIGDGVEASDETRQAVERLLHELLAGDDMEGYTKTCLPKCTDFNSCTVNSCAPLNNCNVLRRSPCAMHIYCDVASGMRPR